LACLIESLCCITFILLSSKVLRSSITFMIFEYLSSCVKLFLFCSVGNWIYSFCSTCIFFYFFFLVEAETCHFSCPLYQKSFLSSFLVFCFLFFLESIFSQLNLLWFFSSSFFCLSDNKGLSWISVFSVLLLQLQPVFFVNCSLFSALFNTLMIAYVKSFAANSIVRSEDLSKIKSYF
jgi:hypothetical protein